MVNGPLAPSTTKTLLFISFIFIEFKHFCRYLISSSVVFSDLGAQS
ncbi:hypothetical protein K1726_21655 [Clostridium estertheticum]|nr:hypothetical protein [Clostridium estertheticum]MBX4267213.1 hypothetical protein [Clostridium estertheticum]